MTDTIVELRESSSEGRLYYKPDPETKQHLLLVASSQSSRWTYCVNLDGGSLLLDFNAKRKLVNIELGIPRRHWQISSNLLSPSPTESADVFLRGVASFHGKWKHPHIRWRSSDGSAIKTYGYEHPVVAITNRELSAVQISLGSPDKRSRWVSLSEQCWVQVAGNRLKGFFVNVSG